VTDELCTRLCGRKSAREIFVFTAVKAKKNSIEAARSAGGRQGTLVTEGTLVTMPPTTEEMKRWFQKAEEVKLNGGRDVHVSPTCKACTCRYASKRCIGIA
jgi:hypothetical protein